MEWTILNIFFITFITGIIGGILIADATDTYENRRQIRREKRRARRIEARKKTSKKNLDLGVDNDPLF